MSECTCDLERASDCRCPVHIVVTRDAMRSYDLLTTDAHQLRADLARVTGERDAALKESKTFECMWRGLKDVLPPRIKALEAKLAEAEARANRLDEAASVFRFHIDGETTEMTESDNACCKAHGKSLRCDIEQFDKARDAALGKGPV